MCFCRQPILTCFAAPDIAQPAKTAEVAPKSAMAVPHQTMQPDIHRIERH
jgi:hypothetical protein